MSEQGEQAAVLTERRGAALVITLNRPKVRNAVNGALADGVATALDELDADGALSVGVLTGAGGFFSAGMDLGAFVEGQSPYVEGRGFAGITQRAADKPLIAAIEGFAVAGGLEIALSCDLIVAAKGAKLGIPEVQALARCGRRGAAAPAAAHPVPRRDGDGAHRRHAAGRPLLRAGARRTSSPSRARRSTSRSSSPSASRATARSRWPRASGSCASSRTGRWTRCGSGRLRSPGRS